MNTLETLKLALEALEKHAELGLLAGATITSLRQAIEQAEQAQPVAKACGHECGCLSTCARDAIRARGDKE